MYNGYNSGERTVATRLIRFLLEQGWMVSVYGDGICDLSRSTDYRAIYNATGETDTNDLYVRDAQGLLVGIVTLIWGNSPRELIADWADARDRSDLSDVLSALLATIPDPYATSRMERNISTGLL